MHPVMIGVTADVTDRQEVRQELRLSSQRLKIALGISKVVLYTMDRELRYTWLHSAEGNLDHMIGKRDDQIRENPAQAQALTAFKREVLESGVGGQRSCVLDVDGEADTSAVALPGGDAARIVKRHVLLGRARDRVVMLIHAHRLLVPQQRLDAAQNAFDAADATYAQAKARLAMARAQAGTAKARVSEARARYSQTSAVGAQIDQARARATVAHARVETARAARDLAKLDFDYTKILAPGDGVASKKAISVGQMLSPGQPVAMLVRTQDVWITANFKETQLQKMRPGQPAEIEIDAFPGLKIAGEVESLSGGTGARFSLLPPDNASGNFVKVVQRVPVRIRLKPGQDPEKRLRPGMSAEPKVWLE
jgi:membrane fusion protein (multidrug efflux system)